MSTLFSVQENIILTIFPPKFLVKLLEDKQTRDQSPSWQSGKQVRSVLAATFSKGTLSSMVGGETFVNEVKY